MFPKLLAVILALSLLGSALLELRRQRLEMLHAMAKLHQDMDAARKRTWDVQYRIVEATRPDALREKLDRLGVQMQPVPGHPDTDRPPPMDPIGALLAERRRP